MMVVMIKVIIMVVTVKKLMVVQILQWKSMTVINFQIFVNYDVVVDDHDNNNNDAESRILIMTATTIIHNIHDNYCLITKNWDK